ELVAREHPRRQVVPRRRPFEETRARGLDERPLLRPFVELGVAVLEVVRHDLAVVLAALLPLALVPTTHGAHAGARYPMLKTSSYTMNAAATIALASTGGSLLSEAATYIPGHETNARSPRGRAGRRLFRRAGRRRRRRVRSFRGWSQRRSGATRQTA